MGRTSLHLHLDVNFNQSLTPKRNVQLILYLKVELLGIGVPISVKGKFDKAPKTRNQ